MFRNACLVVIAALILAACDLPTPAAPVELTPTIAATIAATSTALPAPTDTPAPAPTATAEQPAVSFASGGLGLDKAEFETTHTETGTDMMGAIYDDNLIVSFQDDKVSYIERQWGSETPSTPEDVEILSATLIPADSVLVETYNPDGRPETTVNLFMSESLKSRFIEWIGGEAGNFIVQYNTYDGAVTRMIISIGNNP